MSSIMAAESVAPGREVQAQKTSADSSGSPYKKSPPIQYSLFSHVSPEKLLGLNLADLIQPVV
jgi:hypothetical protein